VGSLSNSGRIFRGEGSSSRGGRTFLSGKQADFHVGGGGDFPEGGADLQVGEGKGGCFFLGGGGQTFKLTS
jgi:hypothetical protein